MKAACLAVGLLSTLCLGYALHRLTARPLDPRNT